MEELYAAGFDVVGILSAEEEEDSKNDLQEGCARRTGAALALAAALDMHMRGSSTRQRQRAQSLKRDRDGDMDGDRDGDRDGEEEDKAEGVLDLSALVEGGVVSALLRLLATDNRLAESTVTQAKCAAATAIANLCRAAAVADSISVTTNVRYMLSAAAAARDDLSHSHDKASESESDGESHSDDSSDDGSEDGSLSLSLAESESLSLSECFLERLLEHLVEEGAVALLMHTCHSLLPQRKTAAQLALRAFR